MATEHKLTRPDRVLLSCAISLSCRFRMGPHEWNHAVAMLEEVLPAANRMNPTLFAIIGQCETLVNALRHKDRQLEDSTQFELRQSVSHYFERRAADAYDEWRDQPER